jgi:hypothetical protein
MTGLSPIMTNITAGMTSITAIMTTWKTLHNGIFRHNSLQMRALGRILAFGPFLSCRWRGRPPCVGWKVRPSTNLRILPISCHGGRP